MVTRKMPLIMVVLMPRPPSFGAYVSFAPPLLALGLLLGLYFAGIPLNVSSYTGIIMIVVIIAENAIFTVH